MLSADSEVRISQITVIELISVAAIKVRTGATLLDDAQVLLHQFYQDLRDGKFEVFTVGEQEFHLAERMMEAYASIIVCAQWTRCNWRFRLVFAVSNSPTTSFARIRR